MFFKYVKSSEQQQQHQNTAKVAPLIETNRAVGGSSYLEMMAKNETSHLSAPVNRQQKRGSLSEIDLQSENKHHVVSNKDTEKICDIRDYRVKLDPREEKRRERLLKYATKVHLFEFLFSEWGQNTSGHGITNVFRLESGFLKLLWLVSFLASSAYCIYTIVNIILLFLEYNVDINQQSYVTSTLAKNNLSYVENVDLINISPSLVNNLIKATANGDNNLTQESREKLGFKLDFLLLTCFFNDAPCNSSEFVYRYNFDYTNCYTFNSGFDQKGNAVPIKQVNEAGFGKGLTLELFLGIDDALQTEFVLNSGARVVVHNQSITPVIISEGVDVATGFQTNIGIRRSFYIKLDAPYSQCINNVQSAESYDSQYYRAVFNTLNMTRYTQKICNQLCLNSYVLTQCGCIDPALPSIDPAQSVCNTIATLACVSASRIQYYDDDVTCDVCPAECEYETFRLSLSNSRYPTNYYRSYLTAHQNFTPRLPPGPIPDITKGTALFSIFYDDLDTTYVTETPSLTPVSLLGNIGGNLGVSILTFVELLEVLLNSIFICMNRFSYRNGS